MLMDFNINVHCVISGAMCQLTGSYANAIRLSSAMFLFGAFISIVTSCFQSRTLPPTTVETIILSSSAQDVIKANEVTSHRETIL